MQVSSTRDVIDFLVGQHQQIKKQFGQVSAARGAERTEAFNSLRRLLAVHETAEEEIVHPRARREITDGERVIDARLEEENSAKTLLSEMEQLDVASPEFDDKLAKLQTAVTDHADAEEREEFTKLDVALDESQLQQMRKAVELAEKTAPTHPHPGTESATRNLLVGPFAAMLDRARDAISGK